MEKAALLSSVVGITSPLGLFTTGRGNTASHHTDTFNLTGDTIIRGRSLVLTTPAETRYCRERFSLPPSTAIDQVFFDSI